MRWNPEDYAKNSDAQLKWAQELIVNLNLRGDESVLDVGCGDGKITASFAKSIPEGSVVGTDSSPEMIAYARNVHSSSEYPNLSFDCIDARCLDFTEEFDLIFSNAALHWVDNHQAFLRGASRALKRGGRLIISCGGFGNAADVLEVFSELVTLEKWKDYFGEFHNPYFFYRDRDYIPWLSESGFRVQRLELVPKDMAHQGKDGLAGWVRTTGMPFTQCVPEREREDFIANFVDRYLEKFPLDGNDLAHVRMVRLEVDAFKR
ncbi:methyltransferase domain-containing protein [Oscillatoria sp. FACHB-1406]|uniref:methyltransferase domain-containing protein n=1 Tax=Oscillatoria sp. FACHB-1406 TaxID=2692846 RepID=UPI001689B422|nr:methyltransferase domain-containing protein [Oscillatoria sp. FACHB-1406]MBD2579719.1 methyltransferase domain-containing protein [Oscillatoria sp. FACHB-1406]